MIAESFLFSEGFEIFLIILLAGVTILLVTGNGGFLLKSGKNELKRRTPEQEKQLARRLSIITSLWMVAEILLYFFGDYVWVTMAYIVILVVSMVYLVQLFKKY